MKKTTSGHQLALAVVFYSPLQFLYWYDKPEDVQDEPELEFKETDPCQLPLKEALDKHQVWTGMEQVFHSN